MSYARNNLEVILEKLTLADGVEKNLPVLALSFTLHYPRPNLASRSTLRQEQPGGQSTLSWKKSPLSNRLLFKETVQGPFGLSVEMTSGDTEGPVGRFVAGLAGEGSSSIGRILADDFPVPIRPLLRTPFRLLMNLPRSGGEFPLGIASVDLKSAKTKKYRELSLPLLLEEDWALRYARRAARTSRPRRREILAKAGEPLGTLLLQYRIL